MSAEDKATNTKDLYYTKSRLTHGIPSTVLQGKGQTGAPVLLTVSKVFHEHVLFIQRDLINDAQLSVQC